MVITRVGSLTSPNLLVNHTRPPFNDVRVRRAVDLAIDRDGFIKGVLQGAAVTGAALRAAAVRLVGPERGASSVPDPRQARRAQGGAQASCSPRRATAPAIRCASRRRRGPSRPTSTWPSYVVSELKQVGVEITVKQLDSVQWYGITTRKEFQLGINISGFGVDDPDAILFENYGCTSIRNYTGYCDEGVSASSSTSSRRSSTRRSGSPSCTQIQKKLTEAGARPTVGWGIDHFAQWPHVKNLVPHHSLYNFGRMQEVWLDR